MSRSRRKSPITGFTSAESEKQDKQAWHRAYRRAERQRLVVAPESTPRDPREFGNTWLMDKDGKYYWGSDMPAEHFRK